MDNNDSSENAEDKNGLLPLAMDQLEDGIIFFNENYQIYYVNKKVEETLAFNEQELLNLTIKDILFDFTIEKLNGQWLDMGEKDSLVFRNEILTKQKNLISAEIIAKKLIYKNNKYGFYRLKFISNHINNRNRNLNYIDFRTIVETSNDGIMVLNKNLQTIFVNKRALEMLGYNENEMLRRSMNDFIIEEEKIDFEQKIDNRMMRIAENFERRLIKKDGNVIWTLMSAAPLIDTNSQFNGSFAIFSDITVQKKSEIEILKLNRLYSMLSACNEVLIQSNNEDELLSKICQLIVDKGGYKMAWVGYVLDDEQKTVKPMTYAGNGETYLKKIKVSWADNEFGAGPTGRAIRTGNPHVLNYFSITQFSSWKELAQEHGYASSAAFPLKTEEKIYGSINIYSGVEEFFNESEISLIQELAQDLAYGITNLRARNEIQELNQNLEKRVSERTAQLENLNKELEAFSYTVSHDLKSPLIHLNGYLNLLKDKILSKINDEDLLLIDKIYESTSQMNELIDDILTISSVEHNELNLVDIDLSKIIAEIVKDFTPEIKGRSVNWSINKLPVVKADKNLLRLVYVNLLSNALKFSQMKEQTIIKIGYTTNKNENIFYVNDNGIGFDMKDSTKLFGVFQRLHKETDFRGTGLGLANIRRIIDKHGGRTWAEGEPGKGATFYFSLPITIN